MRWEDERYVRVYTRDTAELLALGWEARALFWEVLRKVDRAGLLPLGKTGVRGLAAVTGIPAEVVGRALALLLEDGCLQLADGVLVCPNFLAAQDAAQSDRARQREKRARDRERAMGNVESQNVTAPSQNVTKSHEVSRGGHDVTPDVTPCCAVPSRAVPSLIPPTPQGVEVDGAEPLRLELEEPAKAGPAEFVFAGYLRGWREHHKGGNPPRLDDKRRKLVARQAKAFPVEDLELAAFGIWRSRWHVESPSNRISFEIALRDSQHVERFRDIALHGDRSPDRVIGLQPPAKPGEWSWMDEGYKEFKA